MAQALVHANNLTKQFFRKGRESAQHFNAVANASLTLQAGEMVAVMGRSGSGKSTLLNMIAGLLEPTEGSVEVCGVNLYALDDAQLSKVRNEMIGVVPQGQTALHALSTIQNVELPYLMYRNGADEAESKAFEQLEGLGIAHLADSYPRELSGGELRRMSIARALVCNPRVVLADEPTGDLDDESTANVLAALRRVADNGAAVLLVTHESAAKAYADRILRMDAGTIHPPGGAPAKWDTHHG